MSRIDSEGVYVGTIEESGLDVTKKGFPQWVARLKATKKFVDDQAGMAHFKLTEPGYVDWSSFNEDTMTFLVLFKSADEFTKETQLLNYEQLQIATGWDGTSFDALANNDLVGKEILFRVQMSSSYTHPETGKVYEPQLQVSWIDAADAPPQRQLKSVDASKVKELTSKLKMGPKKAAAPAKPATASKPGKPAAAASTPATTAPSVASTSQSTTPVAATPATKAPPKSSKKAATPPPPAEETTGLPKETSQADGWEYVVTHKGDNEDSAVEEAWIAACGEVLGDKDQDNATPVDWAKIRDVVIKDLVLS